LVYLAGSYPRTVKATLSGIFILPKSEPRLPASPIGKLKNKPETTLEESLAKFKNHSETISPAPPYILWFTPKNGKKEPFFARFLPRKKLSI
jgi:hypothetical protein